jgi:hypothetical protein
LYGHPDPLTEIRADKVRRHMPMAALLEEREHGIP